MTQTKKPRVLLAGHLPPPVGGIGTFCQALLASRLTDMVDLRFVLTSCQSRTLKDTGIATWQNFIEAIKDCGRFAGACLAHRPAVTHICTAPELSFLKHSFCAVFARLTGSRVVLHPHCSFARLYAGGPFWKWYCTRIFGLSSVVITLSNEWSLLQKLLPRTRVIYLPNAIDIRPYQELAAERSPDADRPLELLYLGYLGEKKGTFDLLAAFETMDAGQRKVVLNLVGEFLTIPDQRGLEEAVGRFAQAGKECRLWPPAFWKAKLARFEKADIFIYPSHDEGMPMAILEAMAAGLPVVAAAVGGIPDLIRDGVNGFLAPARSPRELGRALGTLCRDGRLRSEFGGRNLRLALDFDIENYARKLADIYAGAAAGKGSN